MILIVAFLAGFASLVIEVVGVHFMSPWFGNSSLVWSNQIGLILLAMAIGAALGGRTAKTHPAPVLVVARLLMGAGFLLGLGVIALPLFAEWILPDNLRLDQAAGLFLSGSFSSTLLFHSPPVFLLAMIGPLLVQAKSKEYGAGGAAGLVSAAGTIGSLLGVFGSSFFFVPVLGIRMSLISMSALLLLASLFLRKMEQGKIGAISGVAALFIGGAFLFPYLEGSQANLPDERAHVLASRDSSYQHLRILEMPSGERWLQMNEGVDSYQSTWSPATIEQDQQVDASMARAKFVWPGGYYDLFSLAPLYAFDGNFSTPEKVEFWSLGFASGTALGPIDYVLNGKDWKCVGVELDPLVVELSQQFMPLPNYLRSNTQLVNGDARAMLRSAPRNLDFLILDAYQRQFEIPLHLASAEFFAECYSHLREGGVLVINLGTTDVDPSSSRLAGSVFASLADSFGENIRAHAVSWSRNMVVFARKGKGFLDLASLKKSLPSGLPLALGASLLAEQVWNADDIQGYSAFRDNKNPLAILQAKEWLGSGQ